jgi:hypothetical protein
MDVPKTNSGVTSTPQNTPANAAPISSRAQQPGVGSIKEGTSQYLLPMFLFLPLRPRACVERGLHR